MNWLLLLFCYLLALLILELVRRRPKKKKIEHKNRSSSEPAADMAAIDPDGNGIPGFQGMGGFGGM